MFQLHCIHYGNGLYPFRSEPSVPLTWAEAMRQLEYASRWSIKAFVWIEPV